MTTAHEIRNDLKDAFRIFGEKAQRFIENETGQIPEEYKEHVKDMVRIQIEGAIQSDAEFIQLLYRTLMNTTRPEGHDQSPQEWFEARVRDSLDEMMCQKTRDTIEEYSLINYDNLREHLDEYDFSGHLDSIRENIEYSLLESSALDNHCNEYMQENVKSHIDTMIEDGDLKLGNALENMTATEKAAIIRPVVQEEIGELLENNIRVKDAVKSALKEVLQDVLRG